MDLLADLTPAQREAVTHVDGPLLVLAAAGSGKTRVITRRVAYLLAHGVEGPNILALTFTNKAAGEMRSRIAALTPDAGVWVGTFHSVAARLLRTYAPRVGLDHGFTIYDQADRLRTIKGVMEQLGLDALGVPPERVEAVISRAKNALIGPETLRKRAGEQADTVAAQVFSAYQERLRALAAVDFDDLLVHLVTILRDHPDVRAHLDARFRYVLVDEYQDTNLAQYAIVRALSVDRPNLCVTGDPDQSIYGWRGANLNNILDFEHDFPGCKVVKLERNYRSTQNILRVADHLIRHNRRRKPKALTTENPVGAPVELTVYETEADEAAGIAAKAAALVAEGEYALRDIAVFCRVTALTRALEKAFLDHRIPYQVVGGVSFYERQEIKDVLAYLKLVVNPKDDVAFDRVVNVPPRGVGKTTLERLAEFARDHDLPLLAAARRVDEVGGLKPQAVRGLRGFVQVIDALAEARDQSAEESLRGLLTVTGYHDALEKDEKGGGEDRLANLEELVTAARTFDRENPGATVVDFLEQVSLSTAVDRWKDEAGAVTLMTLHAAKGLEFPVVFIVGLEEGLLPHARAGESDEQREEERRLLFVGITRARRELYLSRCRVREFRGQRNVTIPSGFLAELPEEPLRVRDLSRTDPAAPLPGGWRRPQWPGAGAGMSPRAGSGSGQVPGRPASFRMMTAAELAGEATDGPPTDLDAFRPGMAVRHPAYGLGRLVAIDGAGPNRKGRVAFTVGGERTFVLARSPLRLVTRQ